VRTRPVHLNSNATIIKPLVGHLICFFCVQHQGIGIETGLDRLTASSRIPDPTSDCPYGSWQKATLDLGKADQLPVEWRIA
jgi:hypothetical protein